MGMRALSFNGPDRVELVELPVPEPDAGEALVRIESSAICGSELKAAAGTNPGHEAAGFVEHAPPASGFRRGERVGISAVVGCGSCDHCQRGVQIYCANRFPATGYQNMHADYAVAAVSALRRIPEGIPARTAVLMTGDGLGVPVPAIRRRTSRPGGRVLVGGWRPG